MDAMEFVNALDELRQELVDDFETAFFAARVEQAFPDDAEIEFKTGDYGKFARATDLTTVDVETAEEYLDRFTDYEYAVTETGTTLGMEVFTE